MRASTITSCAFAIGAIVSSAVSALVPENHWKGLQWMFVLPSALVIEKVFGAAFSSAHRVLTYGFAAFLHGCVFALLFYILSLLLPRLTRRGAVLALLASVALDIVFLILVMPMRELP